MSESCPHRRTRKVGRTREGRAVIDADCIECGETATPDLLGRTIDRGHGVATDGGRECGVTGPSGLECSRVAWHDGEHATYTTDEDGDRYRVGWYECDQIGEPVDEEQEIATDGGQTPPHETDGQPWDWQVRSLTATNLYDDAMREWGADAQAAKASEECAELAAVLSRDLNGQAELDELLREIVDVRIMLEQLALTFGLSQDDLEDTVTWRLEHLDHRLDGGGSDE